MQRSIAVITGGRDYTLSNDEIRWLLSVLKDHKIEFVMVGDCPTGVDKDIREKILRYYCEGAVFYAAWPMFFKRAGPRRNGWMGLFAAQQKSICIAFPGGIGTTSMKRKAREQGIKIIEYPPRL